MGLNIIKSIKEKFSDKFDVLEHVTRVHSRISKELSQDFVYAKLSEKDKKYIIEMTYNAFLAKRLVKNIIFSNRVQSLEGKEKIINIKRLKEDVKIPVYAHFGDAGADLFATEDITIGKDEVIRMKTGIALEIPEGYMGMVTDKSGLASKGIVVVGGIIDSTYRGEINVVMSYHGSLFPGYEFKKGDKIAQIIFLPVVTANFVEFNYLSETERGDRGFGSTGI